MGTLRCAGRVAFVTGASRGIGRAIAHRLASEGAAVVVCSRSMGTSASSNVHGSLQATSSEIQAAGGKAHSLVADVSDSEARVNLIERASEPFGPIDILVNNVALSTMRPAGQVTSAERNAMFDVNVNAPMELAQQALPEMINRGQGWVLNISSSSALQPQVPYRSTPEAAHVISSYGATKACLNRLTEGLAHEVCTHGVFVNAMAPRDIVLTSGADYVRGVARANPDMLEPVEMMAEGALELCTGRYVGRVVFSRNIVHEAGRTVMALDGKTALGDALLLGDPDATAS